MKSKVLLSQDYHDRVANYLADLKALSDRKREAARIYKETVNAIDSDAESVENDFVLWQQQQSHE